MKKENLIWLGVGAVAVYFLFLRKPTPAQAASPATEPTPAPTPTPTPNTEITSGGFSGLKPPSLWTNEELLNYYKNRICSFRGGALIKTKQMPPSPEKLNRDRAVKEELAKRKLVGKCIDYGNFPPPASMK